MKKKRELGGLFYQPFILVTLVTHLTMALAALSPNHSKSHTNKDEGKENINCKTTLTLRNIHHGS